jgi:hypothetical protein
MAYANLGTGSAYAYSAREARPTRSRCPHRSPLGSSGRSWRMMGKRARCWRRIKSSLASTAIGKTSRKRGWISDGMVRPKGTRRRGSELGADYAGQGMEQSAASLRAAGALVQQDLEAGRFRVGELNASRSRAKRRSLRPAGGPRSDRSMAQ